MGLLSVAQRMVNAAWGLGAKSSGVGSSLELLREIYGGRASSSGLSISTSNALGVTTVFACARVLAEGVGSLPCKVYRGTAGGGRAIAADHPAYRLLARRPNDWQTALEFRETLVLHAALCGNGFAFVNRVRGEPAELIPMLPARVEVKHRDAFTAPTYTFMPEQGSAIVLQADQVLHLRGPSWNAAMGLEVVQLAREAIGLAMVAETHGARTFANGGRIAGVLSSDTGNMGPEQIKQIRESWESTYGGSEGAGKTAILWGGLKWQPIAMEADKAQFLETRKFQVEEICRAFRVFPQMVGFNGGNATYASAEQFFLAHVVHSLMPWVRRFEEVCDRVLLTEAEADRGLFTKVSVQGLLRGDAKTRAAFYGAGIKDGWLTRNEARAFEELDPIEGLDLPLRPLNMGDGTTAPAEDSPADPPADPPANSPDASPDDPPAPQE